MRWVVNGTPRPLYPRELPGTHCTGVWVGPGATRDGCGKSRQHQDSIPWPLNPWRVVIPTGLCGSTKQFTNMQTNSDAPSDVWSAELPYEIPKGEAACSGKASCTGISALWTECWTQCMTHDNSQNILIEAKSSTDHAWAIKIARRRVIIVIKSRTKIGKTCVAVRV
jgi:hypothetical protein